MTILKRFLNKYKKMGVRFSHLNANSILIRHTDAQGEVYENVANLADVRQYYSSKIFKSGTGKNYLLLINFPDTSTERNFKSTIFGPYSKRVAKTKQKQIQKNLSQASRPQRPKQSIAWRIIKLLMMLSIIFISAVIALLITPSSDSKIDFPQVDQSKVVDIDSVMLKNIDIVAKEAGIQISEARAPRVSTIPVYVFASPDCDSCKSLMQALPSLPEKYKPIILPAGYIENEAEVVKVASSYCAANPQEVWYKHVEGIELKESEMIKCEDWVQKAQASSLIAEMMGIVAAPYHWPVVITHNGRATRGQYPDDAYHTLLDFLESNN